MASGFLAFVLEATVVSLSGVVAPGPMSAACIGKGTRSRLAGLLIAIFHGLVEFPLMLLIVRGLAPLLGDPGPRVAISAAGSVVLLFLARDMFGAGLSSDIRPHDDDRSPVMVGILLSAGNPYFLLWWITIGGTLILRSVQFGLAGFLVFASTHWLCDAGWSTSFSLLSFKGGTFFGRWFQKIAFSVCGLALLIYGLRLTLDSFRTLSTLTGLSL